MPVAADAQVASCGERVAGTPRRSPRRVEQHEQLAPRAASPSTTVKSDRALVAVREREQPVGEAQSTALDEDVDLAAARQADRRAPRRRRSRS